MADFYKYQALGNDYLVINPSECCLQLTPHMVRTICSRHYGIGADGILLGPLSDSLEQKIVLKIYNSDGSEAEKSGNGLRIFAWFLYEHRYVNDLCFLINTSLEKVTIKIIDVVEKLIEVDMGIPNFYARIAASKVGLDEIIDQQYQFGTDCCRITFVSVGNPHCVVYGQAINKDLACRLGPLIEQSPLFPEKVNVQFLEVVSKSEINIQIWERGSGYTLASGSSSCAAVVSAYKMGLVGNDVIVNMPGGKLRVTLVKGSVHLIGPVASVMEGNFTTDFLNDISNINKV